MNPCHPPPNSDKENHAETIILCDSNGRYLQPSLPCPNTINSYIRCPTLTHVNGIPEKTKFTKPTCSIVHTGTNDIKHSSEVETLGKKTVDIVDNHCGHPNSQIIISSLLPRNDELHNKAEELNTLISSSLDSHKNVTHVKHSNIKSNRHLHDKKHLNQIGVKRFAQNLKRAYFRQESKPTDSPRRYHNKPYLPHFQLSIPNWKSPNSHPPSSASPFVPHFLLNQRLPPNINQQQRPPQDPAIYSNRLRPPTNQERNQIPKKLIQLIMDLNVTKGRTRNLTRRRGRHHTDNII